MKRTAWVGAMIAFALSQQAVPSAFAIGVGQRCGGFLGKCSADLVCDLDFSGSGDKSGCTGADILGRCVRVQDHCPIEFNWVCGCHPNKAPPREPDLKLFPSDCERQRAGYSFLRKDSCAR